MASSRPEVLAQMLTIVWGWLWATELGCRPESIQWHEHPSSPCCVGISLTNVTTSQRGEIAWCLKLYVFSCSH